MNTCSSENYLPEPSSPDWKKSRYVWRFFLFPKKAKAV